MLKTRVYIDGANLHQGMKSETCPLDYAKLYKYLSDKYHPESIYIFMGRIESKKALYSFLEGCGYVIVFKGTFENEVGEIKGNVDAEIILKTVEKKNVTPKILAPTPERCSYFLRRHNVSLTYLNHPSILARIRKDP